MVILTLLLPTLTVEVSFCTVPVAAPPNIHPLGLALFPLFHKEKSPFIMISIEGGLVPQLLEINRSNVKSNKYFTFMCRHFCGTIVPPIHPGREVGIKLSKLKYRVSLGYPLSPECLRFVPDGHSSPDLKAFGFLSDLIKCIWNRGCRGSPEDSNVAEGITTSPYLIPMENGTDSYKTFHISSLLSFNHLKRNEFILRNNKVESTGSQDFLWH